MDKILIEFSNKRINTEFVKICYNYGNPRYMKCGLKALDTKKMHLQWKENTMEFNSGKAI